MKKMRCEICGSNQIRKGNDNTFICQDCGMQYDISMVRNLLQDEADKPTKENDINITSESVKSTFDSIDICKETVQDASKKTERLKDNSAEFISIQKSAESDNEESNYELNCHAEFQSFLTTYEDKTLLSPSKDELKECFKNAVVGAPEDSVLIIKSYEQQKRFDSIEILGNYSDGTVTLTVKINNEEYHTRNLSKKEAWLFSYEYAQSGNIKSDKINLVKNNPIKDNTPKKGKSAEDWIHYCGIMGLTPYTFILGIVTIFLIGKAKNENSGTLSKRAKRDVILGVSGFVIWILVFVIIFSSI